MDWGALGINLAVSAAAAAAVLGATAAIGFAKRRHRVVDGAWGLGFAAVAAVTFAASAGDGDPVRRWIVLALTAAWGARLSVHLIVRNWGEPEDRRYERMLEGAGPAVVLAKVYLLQGLLVWFVSLPVQVAQYDPDPVGALAFLGAAVWAVGMAFETVGDAQLAAFRRDRVNEGRVLDSGLWRYTRHPNYFGDACVWWGLYLLACGTWPGVAMVLSPLVMTWFLASKTGKPLLEEHLSRTRPAYAGYVRRTSGFIPLPPKSSPSQRSR